MTPELWQRIKQLQARILGRDPSQFFPPARPPEVIAAVEASLGFALPPELRASYGVYDAVVEPWHDCGWVHGVEELPVAITTYNDLVRKYTPPFRCGPGSRPPVFGADLIPFAWGPDTAYSVDLAPVDGGVRGQVVAVDFGNASCAVVAPTLLAFFELGIRQLEAQLAGAPIPPMVSPAAKPKKERRRGRAAAPKAGQSPHAAAAGIPALWKEILDLNRRLGETDLDSRFEPGASEGEIAAVERALGFPLPDDLRASFRSHAGVTTPWLDDEVDLSIGLLPNIDEIIRETNDLLGPDPELQLWPGTNSPVFGKGVIPLSVGDPMLGYDLDPGEGGSVGQIGELSFESGACRVVAPSLTAALERGVARLRDQVSRAK